MHNSNLKNYKKIHSGKVRDIYEIDNNTLLIVTTDRISVFDKVLPNIIPEKGIILNEISNFWFKRYKNLIPNHIIDYDINSLEISKDEIKEIAQRSITVKKLKTFPIEAIVRFYLSGSGYNEYLKDGYVCGIKLPKGLRQSEKLPEPIFTPSTKANVGDHDLNITHDSCINIIGKNNFEFIKKISIEIFNDAYAVLVLTEWSQYSSINWKEVAKKMIQPGWIFDSRSILDSEKVKESELNFWRIGDGFNAKNNLNS